MKQSVKSLCSVLLFLIIVISCNQEEQGIKPNSDSELGEIAKLEKSEGVAFFKKEFTYTSNGNDAVLTIATRNEEIFRNVIETMDVHFTPIYEIVKQTPNPDSQNVLSTANIGLQGEEIMIEFTKLIRAKGVIGIKTDYITKADEHISGGRTETHGYDFYVNHYSNHWPSYYTLVVNYGADRTGAHFYARWKWYQGYGSRTVCVTSSPCSYVGACAQDWDLPYSNCSWTWNVDGPYQMEATIGYFSGASWSDYWTY